MGSPQSSGPIREWSEKAYVSSSRPSPCLCQPDNPRERRMRLGTFNVNGKMPSQDLSAWVQKSIERSELNTVAPALPPVKNISPLSLGEVVRNPFTWRGLCRIKYHVIELTTLSSSSSIEVRSPRKYISDKRTYIAGRFYRPRRSGFACLRISGTGPFH